MGKKILNKVTPLTLFFIAFGCLILFTLVVLAVKTPAGVSPDETYHYLFPLHYEEHSLDPFIAEQSEDFALGDVTRVRSYAYAYILSVVLRLTPFIEDQLTTMRLFTVVFSVLNFALFFWLAKLLLKRKAAILSAVFLIYSFLMYLFLGAFLNYDNPSLTFTLLMFISYVLFRKKNDPKFLMYIGIFGIIATMLKFTILPLFILVVVVAFISKKTYKHFWPLGNLKWVFQHKVILLGLIVSAGFFLERFGLNIIQYKTTQPSCNVVHPLEKCMENGVFARNYAKSEEFVPFERVRLLKYLKDWVLLNYQRGVGIFAHKPFPVWDYAQFFLVPTILLGAISALYLVIKKRFGELRIDLLLIVGGYVLILIFGVQYPSYLNTGWQASAIQGRYLFPILPLAIILLASYVEKLLRGRTLYFFLLFVAIYFVLNFYYLFNNIDLLWH